MRGSTPSLLENSNKPMNIAKKTNFSWIQNQVDTSKRSENNGSVNPLKTVFA